MNEETLKTIQQLLEWHENQVDQLNQALAPDCETIKLGKGADAIEITNPETIKGIRTGIQIALSFLGKLPVTLS